MSPDRSNGLGLDRPSTPGNAVATRGPGRLRDALATAVLLLSPVVLLAPAIGPGRTVFGIDFEIVFYFTRAWVASELRAGRLPVWDPHTMAGFPLLAAVQAAVFYPPTWLQLILPPAAFWSVITWLHLAFAGIFASAWLRRGLGVGRGAALTGALPFALSGYVFAHLYAGHVNYVWAYPWGAFALWRLERWLARPTLRRAVLLALPLPLMVLAGVPQLAFATGLLLTARCVLFTLRGEDVVRARLRVVGGAAAAVAIGTLLAAPQILPTLELIGHSQRMGVNDADFVTSFSLPPESLLSFLAPTVFGDAVTHPYWGRWLLWEISAYVGIAGLTLAVLGAFSRRRQSLFWVGAALLAILVALGSHTPIFAFLRTVVPVVAFFRGPGRYLYVFVLAAAALASFGAQSLLAGDSIARRLGARVGACALLVAVILTAASSAIWTIGSESPLWRALLDEMDRVRAATNEFSGVSPLPLARPTFVSTTHSGALEALLFAAAWSAASGVVLLAFGRERLKASTAVAALALLLVVDLGNFDRRYVRPLELGNLEFSPRTAAVLARRLGPDYRVTSTSVADAGDPGRAHLAGLEHTSGYEPMLLQRYADLFNAINGQPLGTPVVGATFERPDAIAAIFGAKVWLSPGTSLADPRLRPVSRLDDGRELLEWRGALPRLFLVPRSIVRPDVRERLALMTDRRWDPRAVVVLEDEALHDEDFGGAAARGEVEVLARASDGYTVDVDAPAGGFLVLSEAWFPGWRAIVDGIEVPLLRANHLFQAVRLEPGRHRVRFVYRPRYLTIGLVLAVGALLVPCVILVVQRRSTSPTAERSDAAVR